jgi:phosphate transporter
MKFARQLEYNAYAPWHTHYINFKKLNWIIKQQRAPAAPTSVEERWDEFRWELERERRKYTEFFVSQLHKIAAECNEVILALQHQTGSNPGRIREECLHLFLKLSELTNFINLNLEGTRKAAKKFDKFNGTNFLRTINIDGPEFSTGRETLKHLSDRVTAQYADVFTAGEKTAAAEELSRDLSDLLVWEKGTIWNDLLRLERSRTRLGITRVAAIVPELKQQQLTLYLVHGIFILIFIALNSYHLLPLTFRAQKCLGIVLLVSALWSLGAVPLYITSLLIPVLLVPTGVLDESDGSSRPGAAAKDLFGHFWGSSQCLVLASFTLASGLSKLRLDREMTNIIVAKFGRSRRKTLFIIMLVAFVLSGLIGNVAASVLGISTITPILHELPRNGAAWVKQYASVLLLGVAIACNLGGMITPVASPQNVIAFSLLSSTQGVSFGQWCAVGGSTGFIALLLSFAFLSRDMPLDKNTELGQTLLSNEAELPPRIAVYKGTPWTREKVIVIATSVLTLSMWLSHDRVIETFGDTGLASLIPIIVLFSLPNFLSKSDFLSLPWDVCILISGGSLLGHAVSYSGLLVEVGGLSQAYLTSVPTFICVFCLCFIITLISTFVSHTAAANVLMPFILEITSAVTSTHVTGFAIVASLCLSAGMALPISSFPNMNSISVSPHENAPPWLTGADFVRPGVVLGTATTLIAITVGVAVASALGLYLVLSFKRKNIVRLE